MSWHRKDLKGKLICHLKIDIRGLVKFHVNSRNCEHLEFAGLLLSNTCKDLDEKLQKTHVSLNWRVMQSLKKRLTFALKNNMRNLVNFHATSCKSENLQFDVLLLSIAFKVQITNYRRMISHYTEEWSKLWRKADFLFENGRKRFSEF